MIDKIKRRHFFWWLLLFLLVLPTFIGLFKSGYFPMHDDISAMRLLEMDKCVKDGQIPCRWVPDMGFGYGYPQFNYYAPLPYYIMEVFHLGGLGYLDSVKAGFILSFVLSGVGMYLLGRTLWGRSGGFISALFYAYLPYRAVDVFVRGAVGELYAYAFLPFIFWACKKTLEGDKYARLVLALSTAALLTSHNIISMIILPFLAGWIIFILISQKLHLLPDLKKRILDLTAGFVWGFGLAAFFILPAFFERNLVHIETLTGGYFNYFAHFVSVGQLLFSTYWGYGVSEAGPWDEASFTIGLFHWLIPLLAVVIAYVLKIRRKIPLLLFWIVCGFTAAFMAHSRSAFIWKGLPLATFIQFPWRFLLLSGFFFSIAAGAIALFFPKGVRKIPYLLSLSIVLILFYAPIFTPSKWTKITDSEKFSGDSWRRQQTMSLFDYLPIDVKKGPLDAAPENPLLVTGQGKVINWQKGTNWQKGKVRIDTKARIELPIYFFPGWGVTVNGTAQKLTYENELALIMVDLEPGEYDLEARLKNTPVRLVGNIITLLGLFAIPIYLKRK